MALPAIGGLLKVVGALAGLGGADKGNKTIATTATVGAAGALMYMTQLEGLMAQGTAFIVALISLVTAVQAALQEKNKTVSKSE